MRQHLLKNSMKSGYNTQTGTLWKSIKKQSYLQVMALLTVIWLIIFCYIPMFGLQIAFKDYTFKNGILGSPWVGLKHFKEFFIDPNLTGIVVNTVGISLIKTFLMFPIPIILAILLNEVANLRLKKTLQTISYFPYFISWAVAGLLATNWLSPSSGFINTFLVSLGILKEPYHFLGDPNAFWWVSFGLEAWKNAGWGAIIYSASIAGIDQELYEAAYIDGAGRLQRIFNITVPSILGTVMILFILNIGSTLGGGLYGSNFQLSFLLGNQLNLPRSEILDTYVLKIGINFFRYSYATAVGLLTSTVSMILLFTSNYASKKITQESFF